jgi:sugar lactone lactonase YvrE
MHVKETKFLTKTWFLLMPFLFVYGEYVVMVENYREPLFMLKMKSISILGLFIIAVNSYASAQTSFTPTWTLSEGLAQPESVVYDAKLSQLYVSNVQGEPGKKDGKGYIARISLAGKLLDKEWVKGLNAPKGMAIVGSILYVSDIDALVAIDINKKVVTMRYEAKDAKFLNDVTVDKAGNVYVSDTFTNTIYCRCDGKFAVWLQDSKLMSPNGLLAEADRLVVGSWGIIAGGFTTSVAGHLQTISYTDKKIVVLGDSKPVGNLDGLAADGSGGYYATDWTVGKLFHFNAVGKMRELMRLKQGSADLAYLADKKLLLIPMMNDNQLKAFTH